MVHFGLILTIESKISDVLWGVGLFAGSLLAIILAVAVFMKYRSHLKGETRKNKQPAFSLDELRIMKDENRISQEEYKILRDKIINNSM